MYVAERRLLTLLALVCLAPAELPGQTATVTGETPAFTAGEINVAASRVFTHVYKKTSLGHEHAIEGLVQGGRIRLVEGQPSGEIAFDMRSFRADTLTARQYLGLEGASDEPMQQQVTDNMLSPTVLDVARHPTAVFQIERVTQDGNASRRGLPQYRLDGYFTLCKTTRPLTLLADVEEKNGWTHLRCSFTIKQTEFGMTPFTKAFGAIGVADQLSIYGDLWVAGTPAQLAQLPASTTR